MAHIGINFDAHFDVPDWFTQDDINEVCKEIGRLLDERIDEVVTEIARTKKPKIAIAPLEN